MTTDGKSIRDIYNEGIQEVTKIIQKGDEEQADGALKSLDDLTAMMLAHTVATVQGRTALLTGLIAELTEVIDSIREDPPYAEALTSVTTIVDKARKRLAIEKKGLLAID